MGKPKHAKRTPPRPVGQRRRQVALLRLRELRARRELERWRKSI